MSSHMEDGSKCRKVIRVDCVGYVQKRLGKALRKLHEKKGKLADRKPAGGKSGRLTKVAVENLQVAVSVIWQSVGDDLWLIFSAFCSHIQKTGEEKSVDAEMINLVRC